MRGAIIPLLFSASFAFAAQSAAAQPSPPAGAAGSAIAGRVWRLTAGGPPGSAQTLGSLLADFRADAGANPNVSPTLANSLAYLCFRPTMPSAAPGLPSPDSPQTCGLAPNFIIVVPAADAGLAPAAPRAKPGSLPAGNIGMTLSSVLAMVEHDPLFAGKTIERARDGTLLMVAATFKDPPPARYDHGMQVTTDQRFLFRGGKVAAFATETFEN